MLSSERILWACHGFRRLVWRVLSPVLALLLDLGECVVRVPFHRLEEELVVLASACYHLVAR
jgi:hypothetical protein